ncbi:Uncharacterized protein HZ326_19671 [Fusarium oxysporum f. sp. albedinis]|nr:Uncharacterized protein HZ326_19671 [Fusarium oxysporum f. sp. albedinis]
MVLALALARRLVCRYSYRSAILRWRERAQVGTSPSHSDQGPNSRCRPWPSLNPRGLLVDHNTTHAQSILAVRRFVVAVYSPARDIELKKRRSSPVGTTPPTLVSLNI